MATAGQRRVMIAIDGSDGAEHAFDWFLESVLPNDYIYGVTCVEYNIGTMSSISVVGPLADTDALTKSFQEQHKHVEKLTSDYVVKLRRKGVKGQVDYVSGKKPGPALIEFSEQIKADLIIMGTRGLGTLKRMVLGSVSNYVLQNADCPVTVIPFHSKGEKSS